MSDEECTCGYPKHSIGCLTAHHAERRAAVVPSRARDFGLGAVQGTPEEIAQIQRGHRPEDDPSPVRAVVPVVRRGRIIERITQ